MTDSDKTHYAVGSGESESSAGIPRVGEIIADKYRVDRVVGIGGMGVVLAVTHLQIQEPYAIKFLLPKAAGDKETIARFLREARAAVRIKSEHIARVSDVGQTKEGTPFIVMELLEGSDLGEVLAERGPLPVAEAVEYVLQACEGIAEAHALGVVHRDLKPANLFLTRRSDGVPFIKVLDFGIAKAPSEALTQSPTLTDTHSVFGSPAYMSPEQIRSAKNVDGRTDIWALGVILHELLTGQAPFAGETAGAILSAIAADPPASLRSRRPDAPEELDAIVARCLSKSVDGRFATIGELAQALDPFKSQTGIASLGRIQRLSNAPRSGPQPTASERSSTRGVARSIPVIVATDAPVSGGGRPAKPARSRMSVAAGLGVRLGVLALVGAAVVAARMYSSSSHGPAASASPGVSSTAAPTLAEGAVTTALSVGATSALSATSAAETPVAPASSASATPSLAPTVRRHRSTKPTGPAPPVVSSPAAPPSAAPPVPPPAPSPTRDPISPTSH